MKGALPNSVVWLLAALSPLQAAALRASVPCWLLAREHSFSFLTCRPVHRAVHKVAADFPPRRREQERVSKVETALCSQPHPGSGIQSLLP